MQVEHIETFKRAFGRLRESVTLLVYHHHQRQTYFLILITYFHCTSNIKSQNFGFFWSTFGYLCYNVLQCFTTYWVRSSEKLCHFKSVPAVAPKGLDILMELEKGRVLFKDNPPERKYELFFSPMKLYLSDSLAVRSNFSPLKPTYV